MIEFAGFVVVVNNLAAVGIDDVGDAALVISLELDLVAGGVNDASFSESNLVAVLVNDLLQSFRLADVISGSFLANELVAKRVVLDPEIGENVRAVWSALKRGRESSELSSTSVVDWTAPG